MSMQMHYLLVKIDPPQSRVPIGSPFQTSKPALRGRSSSDECPRKRPNRFPQISLSVISRDASARDATSSIFNDLQAAGAISNLVGLWGIGKKWHAVRLTYWVWAQRRDVVTGLDYSFKDSCRGPLAACFGNLGDSHPSAGDVTPEETVGFVHDLTPPSLIISLVI